MSAERRRPPKARKGRIGGNPLVDEAEHTPPVSPQANAEWRPEQAAPPPEPAETPPATPVAVLTSADLPQPYEVGEEVTGPLNTREKEHLQICEAAVERARTAFYYAGRALQVIRDGRLYRDTHENFEDYLLDRWGMSRPQAYRLIDAWPIAERLSPIGDNTLTESQVRELVPVAKAHGQDAAVTVYETIATTDGVKVTAGVIKGATNVLPDQWNTNEAVERIRAFLAGELTPQATATAVDEVTAATTKVHRIVNRVVRHTSSDPDKVRELAAELRTLADQMEKDLG